VKFFVEDVQQNVLRQISFAATRASALPLPES
jgi:hypothetical protein